MRTLEALSAAVAALLALGVSVLNAYPERCRAQPSAEFDDVDTRLFCGRQPYGVDPLVRLEGQRTRYLNIECLKDIKDYTCADIPEFDFGQNGTIVEISFKDCPLAFVSIACVSRRLRVLEVLKLTVEYPSDGFKLLHENVEGLQGPGWISLKGNEGTDEELMNTSEVLAPLSTLKRLTLAWVNLRLEPGALAVLRALTHLTITEAYLSDNDLMPGVLANLPALTHLSFFLKNIQNIEYDTFQNLTSLEVLDVSHNQLTSLDGAVLAAGCPRLRELYASGNDLKALHSLEPLQYLEKVSIEYNPSFELSPHALGGLPNLAHVILRECRLQALPQDLFAGSKSLFTLDLSDNKLRALPVGLFSDQHLLQELDLSRNELETLPQELFSSLAGLQRLNLDFNRLQELPDWFLERLPARNLQLLGNPLRCDCHMYNLALYVRESPGEATLPHIKGVLCYEPTSQRFHELSEVDLQDLTCKIPSQLCPPDCLCAQHPLTVAMDCIAEFDPLPQQFSKLPIELKLRVAPSFYSWIPSTVQTLDLSNVRLREVPMDLNLTAIKNMDLSGNMLTRVPVELLAANVTVKLAKNPLVCDCWHAEGIKQLQAARALVKDYEELTCDDGLPMQQVDAQGLCSTLCGWWDIRC